jgi:2-polyprenyl-3-methyl-5-hydroxy-6-metoxy-1,4-benzoquinol methylase
MTAMTMIEAGACGATAPAISEVDRLVIAELHKMEDSANRIFEWLYDIIAPALGNSILEVGSGVGVISKFLVARGQPVILTDHEQSCLDHLQTRFGNAPHVSCRVLDLTSPHYDLGGRVVDTVVCVNVLEHLEDDRRVLHAIREALAPGGTLILQVPNYPALYGSLDEAYGHFRRYTRTTLAERLHEAGFRLTWMRNFNPLGIPGWFVWAKVLRARHLSVSALRLYNLLVPLARRLDFLSRFGGLGLIACARSPARAG